MLSPEERRLLIGICLLLLLGAAVRSYRHQVVVEQGTSGKKAAVEILPEAPPLTEDDQRD
jgi:hypothetical protein